MMPLAHLGLGSHLARPWWKRLSFRALLLGTLLPDLIDKPLYYIPHWLTGRTGSELGLISGTRSFGHTLFFLAAVALMTLIPGGRRLWWLGIALGVGSHLLLDNLPELFTDLSPYAGRIALLFPMYGYRFPLAHHRSALEHFRSHLGVFDLVGELAGGLLLLRLWRWRRREKRAVSSSSS